MGVDRNYLTVEPADGVDPAALEDRLFDGDVFDEWSRRPNGNVAVAGVGADHEPAEEALFEHAPDVDRALLVHVWDSLTTATGWFYGRPDGELTELDAVEGAEPRYGIDVVDYVRREHDFHAVR